MSQQPSFKQILAHDNLQLLKRQTQENSIESKKSGTSSLSPNTTEKLIK